MPLSSHRNHNAGPKRELRSSRNATVVEEVIGRLITLDPDGATIEVEDERTERTIRIDIRDAKLRNVSDADGNGRPSVTDLFPGDRVEATIERGGSLPARARSLRRIGPPAPVGGLRRLAA